MRRSFISILLLIVILAAGAAVVGGYAWAWGRYTGPGPSTADNTVIIPRGSGLKTIARTLAGAGIIGDQMVFRLGARVSGVDTQLKAGEYTFPAHISSENAAKILASGKTVVHRLTVPEGLTSAQIYLLLLDTDGLEGDIALPVEGTMLPETYHFSHGDRRSVLARRMQDSMRKKLAALWAARAPYLPFKSPADALILASIVEKETAQADERPLIAGVFMNRLKKGMRLQSDPTVIYGISDGAGFIDRALSRADLNAPNPYNTYQINGLPPGPIGNPGAAALDAVFAPAKTDALYFVADGTGGHVFAKTLKEHNRNVAKWRKIRDARGG
ncbi:MAG: endolytic transglycosylase MltG [Rhodospirillaceae bacterium]|nr:endolytic transglycosylase MltG [Rhodospirillaceae bacterium]